MVDPAEIHRAVQPYAVTTAGLIFGVAWWVWADAVVYSSVKLGTGFSVLTLLPGIGATAALLAMSSVTREDLDDSGMGDDAVQCRSKTVLFVAYLLSLATICGAVILLVSQQQKGESLWIAVSTVVQSVLIVASGILMWSFRQDDDNGGYSYIA